MSDLHNLYQTIILEHSKARHGMVELGPLATARTRGVAIGMRVAQSHQVNTSCGDEVTLRVSLEPQTITTATVANLAWNGEGCSISQASASILTDTLSGLSTDDARVVLENFREMLRSRGKIVPDEEILGDAAAFGGVARYPARVKCAMLPWVAFEAALIEAVAG